MKQLNMTKQQRAELREVKRRLRAALAERKLILSRVRKAERAADKKHRAVARAAARELKATRTTLAKERRIAELSTERLTKALSTRQAVLEGRLVS